jgi:hypothetical protein
LDAEPARAVNIDAIVFWRDTLSAAQQIANAEGLSPLVSSIEPNAYYLSS